jgi:hypothetical protein
MEWRPAGDEVVNASRTPAVSVYGLVEVRPPQWLVAQDSRCWTALCSFGVLNEAAAFESLAI